MQLSYTYCTTSTNHVRKILHNFRSIYSVSNSSGNGDRKIFHHRGAGPVACGGAHATHSKTGWTVSIRILFKVSCRHWRKRRTSAPNLSTLHVCIVIKASLRVHRDSLYPQLLKMNPNTPPPLRTESYSQQAVREKEVPLLLEQQKPFRSSTRIKYFYAFYCVELKIKCALLLYTRRVWHPKFCSMSEDSCDASMIDGLINVFITLLISDLWCTAGW